MRTCDSASVVGKNRSNALDWYRPRYHNGYMTKRGKLLDSIRNNPRDVRFDDLVNIVQALGFVPSRQGGSHVVFVHPNPAIPFVNLQMGRNGKAKPYQVEQVLAIVDQFNLEV